MLDIALETFLALLDLQQKLKFSIIPDNNSIVGTLGLSKFVTHQQTIELSYGVFDLLLQCRKDIFGFFESQTLSRRLLAISFTDHHAYIAGLTSCFRVYSLFSSSSPSWDSSFLILSVCCCSSR